MIEAPGVVFVDVNPDVQPEFTAENRSRFPKMTRAQYSLRSARDVARNLPLARRPLTQAAESLMQANVRHGTQRRVASGTRARLRDAYRDEIESLSRLLGRDLSHWLA